MIDKLLCQFGITEGQTTTTSFTALLMGFIPTWIFDVKDQIIFCFQITTLAISIIAGILSIILYIKKLRRRKKEDNNLKSEYQ